MVNFNQRRLLYTALGVSLPHSTLAFVSPVKTQGGVSRTRIAHLQPVFSPLPSAPQQISTRQYGSMFDNKNTNKHEKNFLEKAVDKIKETGSKYLPALFGPPSPEQERKMAIERRRKEATEEISALFKDAPMGIRMLAKAISPLVSSMASAFEEQSASVADVLLKAQDLADQDAALRARFGGSVVLGTPIGQSSSTSNINGRVTSQVQLQLPVSGPGGSGTASISAVNGDIQEFLVNLYGQYYYVNLDSTKYNRKDPEVLVSPTTRLGKNAKVSNVIDAEFVEKK